MHNFSELGHIGDVTSSKRGSMKTLKFPVVPTITLFALIGLLAFYTPLPDLGTSSDVTSKIFR